MSRSGYQATGTPRPQSWHVAGLANVVNPASAHLPRWSIRGSTPLPDPRARGSAGQVTDAELVRPGQHFGRVGVDAVGAGPLQFLPAVAARHQPDADRPGPPGRQQVPDAVADHHGVLWVNAELGGCGEEQVRVGL